MGLCVGLMLKSGIYFLRTLSVDETMPNYTRVGVKWQGEFCCIGLTHHSWVSLAFNPTYPLLPHHRAVSG